MSKLVKIGERVGERGRDKDALDLFRILRAVKNRFGSTNEIGVFEMKGKGLEEVGNPSAIFLSERPVNAPGSVVTASMEGTRPILVELQALASSSNFGTARRTILGLDQNRVALLVAVMEKKLGMQLLGHDIFMNVAGGVKIDEPAVDMGIVAAVAASARGEIINDVRLDSRYVEDQAPIRSLICAPLKSKNNAIGALVLVSEALQLFEVLLAHLLLEGPLGGDVHLADAADRVCSVVPVQDYDT